MAKLKPLEFDDRIENIDILIDQLKDLKREARIMYNQDLIFRRDWSALWIVINFLQKIKRSWKND